jgi:ATP-dependent helicase YprA (DUF1998 family)
LIKSESYVLGEKNTNNPIKHSKMPTTKEAKSTKVTLTRRWARMEESDIEEAIIEDCLPRYPENKPPKTVQVDAAKNLVKDRNTFVMAGTGCGKLRISEMYFNLVAQSKNTFILVLNPLDALGDNQVRNFDLLFDWIDW